MLIFVFKLLSRLPLTWVQAIGALGGWLVYGCSASYRRRLRENMQSAGLDPEQHATAAAAEAGKQFLEMAWIWLRPRADLIKRVQWADENQLQALLDDGRAVLLLTPHLGSFEAIAQAYAIRPQARQRPMTALYRIPRKQALRPLVEDARAKDGLQLAPADLRGVRMLMRAIRSRQVVGILPDQVPARGDGVWVNFFNRPAYTMTLPARLFGMGNVVVVIAGAQRLPRGQGFRIHLEPLETPLGSDPTTDARSINQAIEKMVLRFPLQYLWGYNRYKTPANASAAPQVST